MMIKILLVGIEWRQQTALAGVIFIGRENYKIEIFFMTPQFTKQSNKGEKN